MLPPWELFTSSFLRPAFADPRCAKCLVSCEQFFDFLKLYHETDRAAVTDPFRLNDKK